MYNQFQYLKNNQTIHGNNQANKKKKKKSTYKNNNPSDDKWHFESFLHCLTFDQFQ